MRAHGFESHYWRDHFLCTIHLDKIMETYTWTEKLTWRYCMCCYPVKGRVYFEELLAYKG